MRIAVTGAAGIVGREVVEALASSHELVLIDCEPVVGRKALRADVSVLPTTGDPDAWTDAFAGVDVVVHLAEDPYPQAYWQRVLHNNVVGTWNVLWTAAEQTVNRVVYASSHWAVRLLELESGSSFANGGKIGSQVTPRPDTPYGAAKVGGELLGRMLVDTGRLYSFVAVRIGSYHPAPTELERYREIGMSKADMRSLFLRCVEADYNGYHVVYGASNLTAGPFDMSDTCSLLNWRPEGLG